MTAIVIDASAFAPFLLPDEDSDLIPGLAHLLAEEGAIAPQHWRLEIANLAVMAIRRERLTHEALPEILAIARNADVEIDTETHAMVWERTLELALAHRLTIYDAAYLELAERAALPLATLDRALSSAAHREKIEVLTA